MSEEVWKDIKGYEGLYQISNLGRVKPLIHRYKDKVFLKPLEDAYGYVKVWLYKNKARKAYKIHRLVAMEFISNPQNKPFVNHVDGNKQNNNITNLEWATAHENNLHACKTGLNGGVKHNKSKLTKEEIEHIRNRYSKWDEENNSQKLSELFGVSKSCICRLVKFDTYKLEKGKKTTKTSKVSDELRRKIINKYVPFDKRNGINALSRKYGIPTTTISRIVGKMEERISKEDEEYIIKNYKPRDKKFGEKALSEQFGVCTRTIYKIIKNKRCV